MVWPWTEATSVLPWNLGSTASFGKVQEPYRNKHYGRGSPLHRSQAGPLRGKSNKGQLSAWRIAETADLQSIVEHHYRQGPKMLLADPLSRICAPSSGFYDPSLPSKFQALAKHLPESVKNIKTSATHVSNRNIEGCRVNVISCQSMWLEMLVG